MTHSWLYTTRPTFSPTGPFDSEIQTKTWFPGQFCDLWPWSFRWTRIEQKNVPLMEIHHHIKIQSNWSIWLCDRGQNMVSSQLCNLWPMILITSMWKPIKQKATICSYTSPHQKSFKLVQPHLRSAPDRQKYRPEHGFQDFHAACDLDLLGEHLQNKQGFCPGE